MGSLLIEPHYLGSQEYFVSILNSESVLIEVNQHFTKQTFKNRAIFLTTNGKKQLSVPVKFGNRTLLKDVQIDQSQNWKKDHWGCFYSAYGRSPFYEYFEDDFRTIWFKNHRFLLDLNMDMMTMCLALLRIERRIEMTKSYKIEPEGNISDFRELILPKSDYTNRTIYQSTTYSQVFGNMFVPNLSIVDLIMNEGSNALSILRKSALTSE